MSVFWRFIFQSHHFMGIMIDRYEGFAFKPNEISWRFTLHPTPEIDGPTWAGRFDLITAKMENAEVQVRLSNSKTEKLGPSVLVNRMNNCK
jgi:hypothetical protein